MEFIFNIYFCFAKWMLGQFFFQIEFSGRAFILIEEYSSKHLPFISPFVQCTVRTISKNDRTEICYQSDDCQHLSFLFFLYAVIHSFYQLCLTLEFLGMHSVYMCRF